MGLSGNKKSLISTATIVVALIIAVAFFVFISCGGVTTEGGGDGGDGTPSAGPEITSVTADDPDNGDAVYSVGDTITFVFSENTNEPFGPNPAKADLDTLFGAMDLGTDYSGTWSDASTLVVTITDASGGTAPVIDTTTFTLQLAGGLKNAAETSEVSTDTSPAITGDYGNPSAGPDITSVTADDLDDADSTYGDEDTITFVFSEDTNQPFGPNPASADLDTLFGAMNLGTDYSGNWSDASTLVITINDATGGTAPVIDTTTFTLQVAGGLKNAAETSEVSTDTSPAITGDWGLLVELSVSSAAATSNTKVRVTFDSNVEQTSAGNKDNYSIPGLSVSDAAPDGGVIVDLTTTAQEDINYTLTVTDVTDTDLNGLGAQNSKTFGGDVAPYIDSVSSYSNTEVVIYFSEAVDEESAETLVNYDITGEGGLSVTSATRDDSDFSRVSLVTFSQTSGTDNYRLTISNVTDLTANALASPNSKDFSGTGLTDTTKPTLLSAELVDSDTVSVQFSEPVDSSTSQSAGNYTIKDNADQDVIVDTATQQGDTTKVWLDISGTFSEILYTLTVETTVKDVAVPANTLEGAPNNTVSFAGEGTIPEDLGDGAVIVNPVGPAAVEGTFSLFTEYKGRIYIGPSDDDDQVFRIKPDGSDPELVTFRFTIDDITYFTSLAPGPDGEDGIDFIVGGTIGGTEYLFIGPSSTENVLDYIYYTTDSGSTLDFRPMNIQNFGGNTRGISSMIVFNDNLYIGSPDNGPGSPKFIKVVNILEAPTKDVDTIDLKFEEAPHIGKKHATFPNDGNAATGDIVGIDSFGILGGERYLANGGTWDDTNVDGGVMRSTTEDPPRDYKNNAADWGDLTPAPAENADWDANRTFALTKLAKIIPAEKAVPAMAVFNSNLYIIKNTVNGPQLWKQVYNVTPSLTTWTLIAENGVTGLTNMNNTNNTSITLLAVNGDRLYIGYDNATDGVEIWRTVDSTDPAVEADFEQVPPIDGDGLGDATNNWSIYGGISIASGGTDYLWLLVGKEGGSLAVFRTSN